jgi:peroxiredoxin
MESFLKNVIGAYQKAESYRDRGRVKLVQQTGRVRITTEMPMELAFQRPNRLLLDAGHYTVASDGKALFFAASDVQQYITNKAPEKLEKKHLQAGSILGGTDEGHPELIDFLIEPQAYETLLSQISRISWKPDAEVAGTVCRVLFYETIQGTKVVSFIDPKRMVLLKVEAETPSNEDESPTPPGVVVPPHPATQLTYELAPVDVNPKLEAGAFAYKPPARFRRVRELGAREAPLPDQAQTTPGPTQAREGEHLLGQPVPPVGGKDLAGKPLAAGELQGKVVLLFFWAISGGEYCLTSIPIVEQVAEQFKARPDVMVLGISGDAERTQIVTQLLERKKATFRNLVDEGMKMQMDFQLGGLPSFVVIGRDGKVAWAKLGAPPSLKEDLIREIEQCLPRAGK